MRVLFTGPAAAGHLFPMVPTAQALQAAGHQVLFAGSAPLDQMRQAGVPTVEIGDGSTLMEAFRRASEGTEPQFVTHEKSEEETQRRAAAASPNTAGSPSTICSRSPPPGGRTSSSTPPSRPPHHWSLRHSAYPPSYTTSA